MSPNSLVIDHQDGALTFKLAKGGFFIKEGRLTISVETEATDDEQFPDCALFCLEGHKLSEDFKVGDSFEAERTLADAFGEHENLPMAHAYFTFHAEEVRLQFTVDEVREGEIVVSLEATHDDVDHYDEKAKITPTKGKFALKQAAKEDLWVPI